jgi:pimeloyl-ACP methyl ester carboxylesterase
VSGYDEFAFFNDNLAEWGLAPREVRVRRAFVAVEGLRQVSALVWGEGPPELVLLHGGGQNAHTYDTVAMIMDRPLVAIDLPHHGHSDGSLFGPHAPIEHAHDVAIAIAELAPVPTPLVAMSYGGFVAIALCHQRPEMVSQLVLVDITPTVTSHDARHVVDFLNGPETFASFDEILARTLAFNPGRSESSLRRGILHNALERSDGTWVWRHQQHGAPQRAPREDADLWQWLEEIDVPVTLVRAMGPRSVLREEEVAHFRRRRPHDTVIEVADADHSVQGSHPFELAEILNARLSAR